jgi:bacillithiol biosynthesis deacetylase BshB1
MKLDYLAFGVHPDDVEIGMAGTFRKASQLGLKTGIVDLTRAEMSSNGTPESRQEEAREAALIMGIEVRENLCMPDRGITGSSEQLAAVVKMICKYKPRVVFMPYWQDRHPDHVHGSHLIQEAVFSAAIRKYAETLGTEPHRVEQSLFYFINDAVEPTAVIDVSDVYTYKEKALLAYKSQFNLAEGNYKTPLNQGFLEMIKGRDRVFGYRVGVSYAEGFVKKGPHLIMP